MKKPYWKRLSSRLKQKYAKEQEAYFIQKGVSCLRCFGGKFPPDLGVNRSSEPTCRRCGGAGDCGEPVSEQCPWCAGEIHKCTVACPKDMTKPIWKSLSKS